MSHTYANWPSVYSNRRHNSTLQFSISEKQPGTLSSSEGGQLWSEEGGVPSVKKTDSGTLQASAWLTLVKPQWSKPLHPLSLGFLPIL